MDKGAKIYVAGHRGLVGSAIIKKLLETGFRNIVTRSHVDLDLTNQGETDSFFEQERPDYVFLAAARVGGILANNTYKAEFIYNNLMIAANVINASYKYGVKKLLNLGSSCIYPKFAPQPIKEEYLLTGSLEPTNEPYAIAKIAAIKLCRYYNEQYNTDFISVMPTNLYGPNDNFHLMDSHVLPALIRKFHLGKLIEQGNINSIKVDLLKNGDNITPEARITETSSESEVLRALNFYGIKATSDSVTITIWGTGKPRREFLFVDDLANACVHLMENYNYEDIGEFVNVGTGSDITIAELAHLIKDIVGFKGTITFDTSKPDGTPRKLLDISRIKKLGWKPTTPIEEGIKKTYAHYIGLQ